MIYHKQIVLPQNFVTSSIRTLLQNWLIPKKIQHELRINRSILVNGQYHSINTFVKSGDRIDIYYRYEPDTIYAQPDHFFDLKVLYETSDFLIVDKPTGIKTHPNLPTESGTLLNEINAYLAPQPGLIVHRLDMATSGVILFSKNPLVVSIFNRQLSTKTMDRLYLAVVENHPNQLLPKTGYIDLPINQDPDDKRKRRVDDLGLPAGTHFEVLDQNQSAALVKLSLETGRTHQLRVHFAAIGHPILGDPLYSTLSVPWPLLLHGFRLNLTVPFTQIRLGTYDLIPKRFKQALRSLNLKIDLKSLL